VGEPPKRNVRWLPGEIMTRSEMLSNFVIGGFGAVGQGIWLAHTLDSYPFKILNSPPGQFYSSVGFVLAFASPLLSLLALRIFRAMRAPFVTAVPVVACPLIFFALFRVLFTLSGYHYVSTDSDLIASKAIEAGFVQEVLWLTLSGCAIGITCGVATRLVFGELSRETV
jgi:uncharacterized membrane protein